MTDQVCLAGQLVSGDRELIRRLKMDHVVTLIESFDVNGLANHPVLISASLIVIDCTGRKNQIAHIMEMIKAVCERHPRLIVLVVDGPLEQLQVAEAFRAGIRDYFRAPYNVKLLVERIRALCRRVAAVDAVDE
jgi:DNA-binding response OmpR family regulator